MNRFELITTLAAVEALEGAGATPGEREAARRARRRLEDRLEATATAPSPPTSHAEELEAHGHLRRTPDDEVIQDSEARMPRPTEIIRRLNELREGRRTAGSVQRWAARLVDRLVLPDHAPDDPRSVAPEVILSLAARPPGRRHADAALRFLDAAPEDTLAAWRTWLEALSSG